MSRFKPKPIPERVAARIGPRAMKDKTSVEWAWQTLAFLKTIYQSKQINEKNWKDVLEEAEEYHIYDKIPPEKPFGSLDAMLQAEIGETAASAAAKVRDRVVKAAQATTGEVLPEGRPRSDTDSMSQLSRTEKATRNGVSRCTQQRLDALATKAPEKLAEVKAGEKSAYRACVEAGIVKVPTPYEAAVRAVAKLTKAEKRRLLKQLAAEVD